MKKKRGRKEEDILSPEQFLTVKSLHSAETVSVEKCVATATQELLNTNPFGSRLKCIV